MDLKQLRGVPLALSLWSSLHSFWLFLGLHGIPSSRHLEMTWLGPVKGGNFECSPSGEGQGLVAAVPSIIFDMMMP